VSTTKGKANEISTCLPIPHTPILSVGNVGPKSDHVERSDLAKRFFIAQWERERAERAKKREAGRARA
jgi:hypothetical protein